MPPFPVPETPNVMVDWISVDKVPDYCVGNLQVKGFKWNGHHFIKNSIPEEYRDVRQQLVAMVLMFHSKCGATTAYLLSPPL